MPTENNLSLLYPSGYSEENAYSSSFLNAFISDLPTEALFQAMSSKLRFRPNTKQPIMFWSDNIHVINYRLDVMEDLLKHDSVVRLLEQLLPDLENIRELQLTDPQQLQDTTYALHRISEIELYLNLVDRLYDFFQKEPIHLTSAGMTSIVSEVKRIHDSEEYQNLKSESAKIDKSVRNVKSITIGVNLDAQLGPVEAGIVSVNETMYRSGNVVDKLLRLDWNDDGFNCLAPLEVVGKGLSKSEISGFRGAVHGTLGKVLQSSVKKWGPVIRTYTLTHTGFLLRLVDEIRFLLGGVALLKKLKEAGFPICKPQVQAMDRRAFDVKGLYNPANALKLESSPDDAVGRRIVLNDLRFDEEGMIYIFTGPNQGGKTVFTQAVGLAQMMLQLGLFVPASFAIMSPVDNIFTHFPNENSQSNGRFGEECQRLMATFERLTRSSLLLMDETFSSTSAVEATYIAEQVLRGLRAVGCRAIFATHLHDLAGHIDQMNSDPEPIHSRIDSLTAQLDRQQIEQGTRSYRIIRSRPEGSSYARHIAEKYGLTYDGMMASLKKRNPTAM